MDWIQYIFFSVSKQKQHLLQLTTDHVGEISFASSQSIKGFAGTTASQKPSFYLLYFFKI